MLLLRRQQLMMGKERSPLFMRWRQMRRRERCVLMLRKQKLMMDRWPVLSLMRGGPRRRGRC